MTNNHHSDENSFDTQNDHKQDESTSSEQNHSDDAKEHQQESYHQKDDQTSPIVIKRSSKTGWLALIIAISAATVAGWNLYKGQQNLTNNHQSAQQIDSKQKDTISQLKNKVEKLEQTVTKHSSSNKVAQIQKNVKQLKSQWQQQTQQLQGAIKAQQQDQGALKTKIEQISQQLLQPTHQLNQQIELTHQALAISYLHLLAQGLTLGVSQKALDQQIQQAKMALMNLQNASQWLSDLHQIQTKLHNYPTKASTLKQLNELEKQLKQFQLRQPLMQTDNAPLKSHQADGWQGFWQRFKSQVKVKKLSESDQQLLNHDTREVLATRLQFALTQLRMSVVRQDVNGFKQWQKQLKQQVDNYVANSEQKAQWLSQLNALQLIHYQPLVLDIDHMIQDIIDQTPTLEAKDYNSGHQKDQKNKKDQKDQTVQSNKNNVSNTSKQ